MNFHPTPTVSNQSSNIHHEKDSYHLSQAVQTSDKPKNVNDASTSNSSKNKYNFALPKKELNERRSSKDFEHQSIISNSSDCKEMLPSSINSNVENQNIVNYKNVNLTCRSQNISVYPVNIKKIQVGDKPKSFYPRLPVKRETKLKRTVSNYHYFRLNFIHKITIIILENYLNYKLF